MKFFKKKGKKNKSGRFVNNSLDQKNVFSYYQNRDSQPDQTRSKNRISDNSKQHTFVSNLIIAVSVLAIIVSIGYAMTLSTSPSVVIVNDESSDIDNLRKPIQSYKKEISMVLKESILNKTKFTINTETLEKKLQEHFSEVTDIAVALPIISRSPIVYLKIAEPKYVLTGNDKQKYIIDEKGRAVKKVESNPRGLIEINDQSGLLINENDQAIPKQQVDFITEVLAQLNNKNVKVESVGLSKFPNELHVKIKDKEYFVKFNLVGDARLQSGSYLVVIKELNKMNINPKSYVDVRVEERVYYK